MSVDFYGVASDSRGNILANKKVCIAAINTSTVLQITSTDAKGRFKFVVDTANYYDVYRGTTIQSPIDKINDINFLGTIAINFGSVVTDPAFAVDHFTADEDCAVAGNHKTVKHFGTMYLYMDESEYPSPYDCTYYSTINKINNGINIYPSIHHDGTMYLQIKYRAADSLQIGVPSDNEFLLMGGTDLTLELVSAYGYIKLQNNVLMYGNRHFYFRDTNAYLYSDAANEMTIYALNNLILNSNEVDTNADIYLTDVGTNDYIIHQNDDPDQVEFNDGKYDINTIIHGLSGAYVNFDVGENKVIFNTSIYLNTYEYFYFKTSATYDYMIVSGGSDDIYFNFAKSPINTYFRGTAGTVNLDAANDELIFEDLNIRMKTGTSIIWE